MKNKKVLSLLLALVIVFSSVGNALAATFDLYHKIEVENDTRFIDFARKPSVFRKVAGDLDNYLQKHRDGNYYSAKEIDEEMQKGAPNASEAIKNLEPYIEIKDSQGATEIDTALNNNHAEYDESKYTPESWEEYISARNELEAIKNQRFEKESIVNEKIAKLTELKEDLVLLPTVDLSELRDLVEEGENLDLSSYTPESSAAYLGAVGEGRNILNNPVNTTEEEVVATVSKIKEKKALLETNYALEVQSIIKPATITVKEGEEIILPTSVFAVMTDNSHKEVAVNWHESITSEETGTYEIQGTAERLQTSQKILVVTKEDFVDKSHLVDAIRRGQALSESKYTPVSYRDLREALENGNQVNDNINATAEEVAAATDRITNAIIALVEQTESDRIVYVENPVKITVNLNEEVVMPQRVTVVLNSGIKIEKPVAWIPSIIDTSTPGIKTAEGRVEETNQRSTLTVEVKETAPTVDKSELQNAITRGEEVNRDLYTPVSLAKMDQALSWAKKVKQMEDTTQGTVDSAKDRLNTAIDELETKPEIPEITNLKPEVDQNVKAGDQVTISFNAPTGGSAGYRIVLPGSVNNSVNTPNMEEKTPGYYEAIWEVPQGFNGRGMLVFISYTDLNGTNAFATAEGKINVTQELVVTYKLENSEITEEVSRGEKPVNTPTESDKEGYLIESWKMDGKTVNPREIIIHENKTFEAVYSKDEAQWIKVDFKLPEGVAFEDGAKTEFEILKSKSPAEQEVSIPAHKEDTVPVGKKLLWDVDLNTALNSHTTFTAELVKDEGQFKTITVVPGENGKLNSPEVDTFEVLKTVSDEEVITQAKELVKANDNYIIDEATLTENTVNISFKKDENKWVNVIFKNGESVIAQHNVAIGQSYKDAGITLPEITDIPVGQKVEWTPSFDEDNNIIKPLEGNDIVYTANFVEDETQYTTIIISTGANGSLVDDSQNSLKVLKTATWKDIKAQAEALVQADENYILDKFILGESEVQDDSNIVENGNYQAKFIKDADKWIDITFKKGEHGKLKLKAETQDSDIVVNVAKGTSIEEVLSKEDIEVVNDTGYLFDKWDPEVTTIDGTSTEFTAQYKKDPAGWVTVKFEVEENGRFEEGEVADQEVLKGTPWSEITAPTPKANEGYVFDKWTPVLPTDPTTQINDSVTYVASFRAVDNLSYDIKLVQVDETGNVILDGHGKPVEIKPTETVENQSYGTNVTVDAPTLENFNLISANEVSITISLDNSENVAIFKYRAKPEAIKKAKDEMAGQAKVGVESVSSGIMISALVLTKKIELFTLTLRILRRMRFKN